MPPLLIYHRFCGIGLETSIREAVPAPTATLLLGPASCRDAGPAFFVCDRFSGENTPLRATSISFGKLRAARFADHNPRRPWGPGLTKESRSFGGGSRRFGRFSPRRDNAATAQQEPAAARATGATEPPRKVFGGKSSIGRNRFTPRSSAAKRNRLYRQIQSSRIALPRLVCVPHLAALRAHQRPPHDDRGERMIRIGSSTAPDSGRSRRSEPHCPVPDVPRRTSEMAPTCTIPLVRLLGGCIVSELERALVIGRATYERWLGTDPLEIEAAATALWLLDPRHPLLPELEIRVRRAGRLRHMLLRALLEATNNAAGKQTRRLAAMCQSRTRLERR